MQEGKTGELISHAYTLHVNSQVTLTNAKGLPFWGQRVLPQITTCLSSALLIWPYRTVHSN